LQSCSRRPPLAHAHVEINIDLSSQTMTVHSGSGETYVWPISSGGTGHPTPRGVFRPRALYAMVHSSQVRQRADAALHLLLWPIRDPRTTAVGNLGRPASHGCVRISSANAATLFAMVERQGAEIRIVGSPFSDVARGDRHAGATPGFAPIRHTRTLKEWSRDPLAR
jgi:lipoprotein-anchoring transpeptidase ErfK/SrfK